MYVLGPGPLASHLLTQLVVYLGDSATLSYLQFIRMIVESVDGPSQFTMDPSRHRLMEATTNLPPDTRPPVLLPDWKTADVLVKAYFTNVSPLHLGMVLSYHIAFKSDDFIPNASPQHASLQMLLDSGFLKC